MTQAENSFPSPFQVVRCPPTQPHKIDKYKAPVPYRLWWLEYIKFECQKLRDEDVGALPLLFPKQKEYKR